MDFAKVGDWAFDTENCGKGLSAEKGVNFDLEPHELNTNTYVREAFNIVGEVYILEEELDIFGVPWTTPKGPK